MYQSEKDKVVVAGRGNHEFMQLLSLGGILQNMAHETMERDRIRAEINRANYTPRKDAPKGKKRKRKLSQVSKRKNRRG